MMAALTVNFGNLNSPLLTGRKNGLRARDKFHIMENKDGYILTSKDNQLITSSYFLGLLGIELKKYATANEALTKINMDGLSDKSRDECTRAIRRGLSTNRELF
jgi:hypothetical protein